jgi:hypothetical protein
MCTECGREQRSVERGWRAYLTVDDEVAIFMGPQTTSPRPY